MVRNHSGNRNNVRKSGRRVRKGSSVWPLVVMICLLAVPYLSKQEILPEGKVAAVKEQAATALDVLSARLRADTEVDLSWPCNESESLALASDTSSKQYSFRSEGEEMQVFSSAGGTVVTADQGRIVISHGNSLETVYEGCTDIYVQPLQKVWKGELIGSIRPVDEQIPELEFQILKEQEPVDIGDYF